MLRLVAVFFVVALGLKAEIAEEDGVLVFTKDNFKKGISDNKFILVEFYVTQVSHSKSLASEYVKAAEALKSAGSNIKLAKFDATHELDLGEEYGIRRYPTLKLFKNGNAIYYNGGRTAKEIVNWLNKKTGPEALTIDSVEHAKELAEASDVVIVGFFKDESSDLAKAYMKVAAVLDDNLFAITSDSSIAEEYQVKGDKIVLLKKFDEGKSVFDGEATVDAIKKFVQTESQPLVVEFSLDTAKKIFVGDIKSYLLLFLSKNKGHYEMFLDKAKRVAGLLRDRVLFVSINTDEEDSTPVLEFFGLDKEELPTMRIFDLKLEEDIKKYKPAAEGLSVENIMLFVSDFIDGKLSQDLLSQDLPSDWDSRPVKVLVASNFGKVVFNKDKTVLVEFYSPRCGSCKQLEPIYDKLAESFESRDEVVIAKIDSTANELEHIKITGYPTIMLYTKGKNKAVQYHGERTLEGMSAFINSEGVEGSEQVKHDDANIPNNDEL